MLLTVALAAALPSPSLVSLPTYVASLASLNSAARSESLGAGAWLTYPLPLNVSIQKMPSICAVGSSGQQQNLVENYVRNSAAGRGRQPVQTDDLWIFWVNEANKRAEWICFYFSDASRDGC
jgi:hypothetical protein